MRLAARLLAFLACLAAFAGRPASAHEVRPALLEITQTSETDFLVLFKQPQAQGRWLNIQIAFPEGCEPLADAVPSLTPSAITETWTLHCTQGLNGGVIAFPGLERTLTDVFVRISWLGDHQSAGLVKADSPFFELSGGQSLGSYVELGVWHILLGLDHVLFVVLLTLLVDGKLRLLKAATAFTIAHSLTLGAAALNFVTPPQAPVEAVVALSIAFLAYEVVQKARGIHTLTAAMPWLAAFAFGLLHGFGFAGALVDLGLPYGARLQALLLFNVGVEVGQIIVIALTLPILAVVIRLGERPSELLSRGVAYGCGSLAVLWVIERTGGL